MYENELKPLNQVMIVIYSISLFLLYFKDIRLTELSGILKRFLNSNLNIVVDK